jgi:phosphogluconate dehydratase
MPTLHPVIAEVTARIRERSRDTRNDYLGRMEDARSAGRSRSRLDCGNLAHACAAAPAGDKTKLLGGDAPNLAIVTAHNDMLSAHQPLGLYPDLIKDAARRESCTAQIAGGVPAMCDGITQGQPGMELSLFSRDVIALATAISLSHNVFDATLCLGVCDKIVPGLLIGALAFGHLPTIFVPAGPMPSGIPNQEKARVREAFARGEAGPGELPIPGAAFVNPGTPLRDALTRAAAARACALARDRRASLFEVIDERAIVNGVVGLMASGGSTNHTLHLPAIARAAGILLDWEDFDAISRVTPLIARIYPNGPADVNQFEAAGGMAFLIRELLDAGLVHGDTTTVAGPGLRAYANTPMLLDHELTWRKPVLVSPDRSVLRSVDDPFDQEGGLKLLRGNLGRAMMKISAVAPERRLVEAPAMVFDDQDDFVAAFKRGSLERDFIAVIRFQGPKANGMPELHKLTPLLSVLQNKGYRVGLVTDGRMSGASGKVPAAIHVTPEALSGGAIGRIQDGDLVRIDADRGVLETRVSPVDLAARQPAVHRNSAHGSGRELFKPLRRLVGEAEFGASIFS